VVARARQAGARLRDELVAALGDDGVMLYPSHPRPAPRHNAPLLRPFAWTYTAVFNALELPVTQVPLGLGPGGLPLGVQVVAGPGRDHLGIAAALALERACGGWVWPGAQRA
jgi:fatty acid amide hydrolase 2